MSSRRAIRAAARRRRRHRRRHLWTVVVSVLAAAVLAPALIAAAGGWPAGEADTEGGDAPAEGPIQVATEVAEPGGDDGAQDEDAHDDRTPRFAVIEGVDLHLPGDPVVLGYHEASTQQALEMVPVGRLAANNNITKFTAPPDIDGGVAYLVLSSRGRPFAATSAVDVVLRDDEAVVSPVTGTVVDVRAYDLYGSHPDERIEIAPADAPGLRVVLVHLDGVVVAEGDQVEAGATTIAASARRFGFSSQIDRETEPDRWPHVHLEVKYAE